MLKSSYNKINLFEKGLTASWLKNQAISNNISNVNTPNYKRETVNFEDVLQNAANQNDIMSRTHEKHMSVSSSVTPTIVKDDSTEYRKDGNNVNIDTEMAELAENQIRYEAITKELNDTLKRLRISIKEG
ncbi:MAG: flagellar basal body rod protein FlgB [Clostridia bacterium]|nr:flagellar basal body rod protein FlgB [Clostridia bacterium]